MRKMWFGCLVGLVLAAEGAAFGEVAKPKPVAVWQPAGQIKLNADLKKWMDQKATELVSSGRCVGIAVGIIDGDKSWVVGYGRKSLKEDMPPDADTIYEIGSVTKTFTAACLAKLCAAGKVKLDDPLALYLPKSVRVPEYKGRKITLLDLATHTSGLPSVPSDFLRIAEKSPYNPYTCYPDAKVFAFLKKCKLTRQPGKSYEYSNMGMGLLGYALSRKTGQPYEQMVRSLIWEPLGMRDTAIVLSPDQKKRFVPGYVVEQGKNKRWKAEPLPSSGWTFGACFTGAGSIRSTVNDLLRYVRANIEAKDSDPLAVTHTPRHDADDGPKIGLKTGLGWLILDLDHQSFVWHNGQTGGYTSLVAFCRTKKTGVVVLTNVASEADIDEFALQIIARMTLIGGQ